MARIFISHASANDAHALAIHDWLSEEGWGGAEDLFLDIHPTGGIAAGERWLTALEEAATRCEAVLFLVSEAWLASKWCLDEYHLAARLHKKLFALLVEELPLSRLPGGLADQWQVVRLYSQPTTRFSVTHPITDKPDVVYLAKDGLVRLQRGLLKAGVGPGTFHLQEDPGGPFGYRSPYRGLEALDVADAAVFFGREADIVRALDVLRGLAETRDRHLLVILGASGAGKSSFLRAGILPRLLRDDAAWLSVPPVRAGFDGALDGEEGLVANLERVRERLGIPRSRAVLRTTLETRAGFLEELATLRRTAADRALLDPEAPAPRIVWALDQAEELFAGDAGPDADLALTRLRESLESGDAVMIATIRSDSYARMQHAPVLQGLAQDPFSLLPVPSGEVARIIRAPAEVLRHAVGTEAPQFAPEVVAALQGEMAGEEDALPLLAFALQRLMRDHVRSGSIDLPALESSGGVAGAIQAAADAALRQVAPAASVEERRSLVRRSFVPRLARVDRESKAFQRRVARRADILDPTAAALLDAFVDRRLLVRKGDGAEATIEVSHEALLRRWTLLVGLLEEDRDALSMLDGVLEAAEEWSQAPAGRREEFLVHRGSRLAEAVALRQRGAEWSREVEPARDYLDAAVAADEAVQERERRSFQRRRALQRALAGLLALLFAGVLGFAGLLVVQQRELNRETSEVLANAAERQMAAGELDSALRLALVASTEDWLSPRADSVGAVLGEGLLKHRRIMSRQLPERVRDSVPLDDGTLFVRTDSKVFRYDLSTGDVLLELEFPEGLAVAYLHTDTTALVTIDEAGVVQNVGLQAGETLWETELDLQSPIRTALHTESGQVLAWRAWSKSGDRGPLVVQSLDLATGRVTGRLSFPEPTTNLPLVRLVAGGDRFLVFEETDAGESLEVWRRSPAQLELEVPVQDVLHVDPGSGNVLMVRPDDTIVLLDTRSGERLYTFPEGWSRLSGRSMAGGRQWLSRQGRRGSLVDMASGEVVVEFELPNRIVQLRPFPDESRLMVTTVTDNPDSFDFGVVTLPDIAASVSAPARSASPSAEQATKSTAGRDRDRPDIAVQTFRVNAEIPRGLASRGDEHHIVLWWDDAVGMVHDDEDLGTRTAIGRPIRGVEPFADHVRFLAWSSRSGTVDLLEGHGDRWGRIEHGEPIRSVDLLDDDTRLLTVGNGNNPTWQLWDITLGQPEAAVDLDPGFPVRRFLEGRVTEDGSWLVTRSSDGKVQVYDIARRTLSGEVALQAQFLDAELPGDELLVDLGGDAAVFSARTGRVRTTLGPLSRRQWVKALDGGRVAIWRNEPSSGEATQRGAVDVWDTRTGERVQRFESESVIRRVDQVDGGDALIIVGSLDAAVLWDPVTGTELARFPHQAVGRAIVDPASDRVVTVSEVSDGGYGVETELVLWEGTPAREIGRSSLDVRLAGVGFVPGSGEVFGWPELEPGGITSVYLWDADLRSRRRLEHGDPLGGFQIFDDGTRAVSWSASQGGRRAVVVWDLVEARVLMELPHEDGLDDVERFAGDTRLFTITNNSDVLRIWDLQTGDLLTEATLPRPERQLIAGTLNYERFLDDARLMIWSENDKVTFVDLESGERLYDVTNPPMRLASLLDDGRTLLTVGEDSVRFTNLGDLHPLTAARVPEVAREICLTRLTGRSGFEGWPRSRIAPIDRRATRLLARRRVRDVCAPFLATKPRRGSSWTSIIDWVESLDLPEPGAASGEAPVR